MEPRRTCLIAARLLDYTHSVFLCAYEYASMAQVAQVYIFMTFCFRSAHGLEHFVIVISAYRRKVVGDFGKTAEIL